jgi:hypothetical protein
LCSLAETPAVRGFGFCTRVAAVHLRPANLVLCRREVAAKVTSKPSCINGDDHRKSPARARRG